MKATGIVRRIDDLGRVVIPKEIRRTMRIREGDPLEIYTSREGEVIFKKYSLMGGLSFMLMSILDVAIGNTGGGLIDFFIWGVFQPGSNWFMVIPVGVVFFFAYYFVFSWYLKRRHLSIDVSTDEEEDAPADGGKKLQDAQNEKVALVIEGLGGYDNIVEVNNCITRLRVDVKDMSLVQEDILKKTGSLGIVKPSETHIQVIYGPKVESIADAVREVLNY